MCRILTPKLPLNVPKILDFYFRRFRRILPPYLIIILLVLLLAINLFLFPFDYTILVDESWRPLAHLANWPSPIAVDYSRRVSFFGDSLHSSFIHLL